jgi:hypothetical protein
LLKVSFFIKKNQFNFNPVAPSPPSHFHNLAPVARSLVPNLRRLDACYDWLSKNAPPLQSVRFQIPLERPAKDIILGIFLNNIILIVNRKNKCQNVKIIKISASRPLESREGSAHGRARTLPMCQTQLAPLFT